MTNYTADNILDLFRSQIQLRLGARLKKVVLFGSQARGEASPESDYDCLAVCDEITSELRDAIDELAGELLFEHNAVFSIFPISEAAYHNRAFDPLLMNARREGRVLYG
ncbi:nucleotidyltransferase domain-containing protein [candidate division KSB1 bacterium]|nr:nucleotidyltransferase domain-containing protein [candidate division KSB1 bacterium]